MIKNIKAKTIQRTAVGRYYYGCFLTGRGYYEFKTHKKLGKDGAHEKLINYFKSSSNPIENNIGDVLNNMRNYRNNADYGYIFKEQNLRKSKKGSKKFFKLFRKL